MKHAAKLWTELRDSATSTVEAERATAFSEFARGEKLHYELELQDAEGREVAVADWRSAKPPLTVRVRLPGEMGAWDWQPKEPRNLVLLLRE